MGPLTTHIDQVYAVARPYVRMSSSTRNTSIHVRPDSTVDWPTTLLAERVVWSGPPVRPVQRDDDLSSLHRKVRTKLAPLLLSSTKWQPAACRHASHRAPLWSFIYRPMIYIICRASAVLPKSDVICFLLLWSSLLPILSRTMKKCRTRKW